LKRLARRVESALAAIDPAVVFAPSTIPLTFVKTKRPVVFATDQVFHDLVDSYYLPRPSSSRFRRLGEAQEQRAISGAARVSYPSEWAAQSARNHYGADSAKIAVIPWGANLPRDMSEDDVASAIACRLLDRCELVFLGRDWLRKGGDTLVATVKELNRLGVETRATIIGANPSGLPRERFKIYPFLNKAEPESFAQFATIMLNAHFLFLPSRAECFAQAFCEAMAFGVPSIGSTVGGMPSLVRDGETGFLRPADTPPEEFAQLIRDVLENPSYYRRMARAAREDYRSRLNWDAFGRRLNEFILPLVDLD
jgi:glycosyltransferase involved in cell wall biosynthesis